MSVSRKIDRRARRGISLVGALAVIAATGTGYAQTMPPQYAPPPPPHTQYMPAPMPYEPAAIIEVGRLEPCGGDFGMLEKIEAARHDVPDTNPSGAPLCD